MNKIEKLLQKLDHKTRTQLEQVLAQLISGQLSGLDIKKIKGSADIYRIRVGTYRIIFSQTDGKIRLIDIAKRDERTYRDY